ncbi:hypothetical protein [Saccharothrix xinjiangensis]|uniref:Uncharacterized protein n=1 Tax=Saccharothrix xinjiangensis TaxID=204798 RepID=A0ABV9Y2H8_9PSEU
MPLSHVVTDRDMADGRLVGRVDLAAVLEVAAPVGTSAIVVPSLDHLSTDHDVRRALTARSVEVGVRLIAMGPASSGETR